MENTVGEYWYDFILSLKTWSNKSGGGLSGGSLSRRKNSSNMINFGETVGRFSMTPSKCLVYKNLDGYGIAPVGFGVGA